MRSFLAASVYFKGSDEPVGFAHCGMKLAAETLLGHERENVLNIKGVRVRCVPF